MKNGNTFTGQITEENEKQVVLKMEYGTMTFKKVNIKKVVKEKFVRPKPPPDSSSQSGPGAVPQPPARTTDKALASVREYLMEAAKALKVRNFTSALAALERARKLAVTSAPSTVGLIKAKIKKVNEIALIVIEIKIDKVFVPEAVQDPAVRHSRDAPPVSDTEARKEAEAALRSTLKRILQQKRFIVIEPRKVKKQRVQKLCATYSDSGGVAYHGGDGEITGYRIHATCKLDLISADGGVRWSETVEAATPYLLRRGTTRDGAIRALEGQMSTLTFGIQ
ncbi:MAG: hypothetical protein GXP25_22100 [Planctomycetes bacterium]|nr:hypothetical protein [Planctomycetota bacterium]